MIPTFRFALAAAFGAAILAAAALACTSSGGGGNIGTPCQSADDCANQYECLAVDDAGACSNGGLTCQQACSDPANCEIVGTNFTCSPMSCAGPGNSGICTEIPTN